MNFNSITDTKYEMRIIEGEEKKQMSGESQKVYQS